jgi:signal transduction histidine kinase
MMQQLYTFFTPTSIADDLSSWEYKRTQLFIVSVLVFGGLCLPSVPIYYALGATTMGHICLAGTLVSGLILWVLRQTQSLRPAAFLLIFSIMFTVTLLIAVSGGILSPLVSGMYAPVLFGLLFVSRKFMIVMFGTSVAIVLVFAACYEMGFSFPQLFAESYKGIVHTIIGVSVLLGILTSISFVDKIRTDAVSIVEKERDSVQEKVHIATRTLEEQQENINAINQHLAHQNTALQEAITQAEAAKMMQAEFLRNVGHEVRTPLSVVLGFSEILAEYLAKDDAQGQGFVQQIEGAGKNLLDMFNNILTLSRFESAAIEVTFEPTHLPSLLLEQEQNFRRQADGKGLLLTCDWQAECDEYVMLDIIHLRQVLKFLISNAIKFTDEGSVHLRCELVPTEEVMPPSIHVIVRDTGIGISREYQDKLFTPFYQQDGSTNRHYGGLGLGLAITKRLVDAMNGRVWCESELGKGATFIVELPALSKKKIDR